MRRLAIVVAILAGCVAASAGDSPKRPRILGIAEVRILSTSLPAAHDFYTRIFQIKEAAPNVFALNPQQVVALFEAPSRSPSNLLAEVVFETDNLGELMKYLKAQKIQINPKLVSGVRHWDMIGLGFSEFSITDPEGHIIRFIQRSKPPLPADATSSGTPSGAQHIIHAGFIVHDRATTEHFYKDILGFRPYWHGGMKDDETSWVSLQVPDGTDWLELMLYDDSKADKHFRGAMNHIALGVIDIHAAQEQLRKNGAPLTEEPKMGRDGKWQLNLYDPDDTRVEFMEFTPKEKPCCSEFTGPHPGPKP